jgi:hypothetical protein
MWESARVRESPRLVGLSLRARASGPIAWHDYSSAWRGSGASQRRSVKLHAGQHCKARETCASHGRSSRSFGKPSACEPGAGRLLPFRGVRVRHRRVGARDVRQVWRDAGAAGCRREGQAAGGLSRWFDHAGGGRALQVRGVSHSSEAGLRRLNGTPYLRPRAGSQGASSGGEGRGRRSCQALRNQHSKREALPGAARRRRAAGRSCHEKDSRVRRACERLGRRSCELHVPCHPQAGHACRTSWPQADARRGRRHQDRGRARHHSEGDGK